MANISEFNRKPTVYVSYWVEESWDKQVTVSVHDVTHSKPGLQHLETIFLRKNTSDDAVLREVLDFAAVHTGIWEGTMFYSGPGKATLYEVRNKPNVKLERITTELNEAHPAMAKAVRSVLIG